MIGWLAECTSMDAAGRGRGRGATLPAWMTQGMFIAALTPTIVDRCMYIQLARQPTEPALSNTGNASADSGMKPAATQPSSTAGPTSTSTANGAPAASKPAWTEHTAPDGRKYYYNASTKQSVWEKPPELRQPAVRTTCMLLPRYITTPQCTQQAGGPSVTTDWTEHTAPDGRKYYYSKSLKKSMWTMPEGFRKPGAPGAAAPGPAAVGYKPTAAPAAVPRPALGPAAAAPAPAPGGVTGPRPVPGPPGAPRPAPGPPGGTPLAGFQPRPGMPRPGMPRPGMPPYYPGYPGAAAPVDNSPLVFATKVRGYCMSACRQL